MNYNVFLKKIFIQENQDDRENFTVPDENSNTREALGSYNKKINKNKNLFLDLKALLNGNLKAIQETELNI